MPTIVATMRALRVTLGRVWLPITVVTASSSISGLPWASRSAMASSWPGSQSTMIFFGTRASLPQSMARGQSTAARSSSTAVGSSVSLMLP